jgi:hypothetical protein
MADKWYIWRGPPTTIEVWHIGADLDEPPVFGFAAQVAPGVRLPEALPEDHYQVEGWLAFKLVEETTPPEPKAAAGPLKLSPPQPAPSLPAPPQPATAAAGEAVSAPEPRKTKEPRNG